MTGKIVTLLVALLLLDGARTEYERHVHPRIDQQVQQVDRMLTPALNPDDSSYGG